MKQRILLCVMVLGLLCSAWAGTGDVPAGIALAESSSAEETAASDKAESSGGGTITIGITDDHQFADHFDPALETEDLPLITHTLNGVQFRVPQEADIIRDKSYSVAYQISGVANFQVTSLSAEPLEDDAARKERLHQEASDGIESIVNTSTGEKMFNGEDYQNWHSCTINGLECEWVLLGTFPARVYLVFEYNGYVYHAFYSGGVILSGKYNNLIDIFFTSLAPYKSKFTPDEDGVIHLSEADSRAFFSIETDNYVPVPETNLQFLMGKDFYQSGPNGQEKHVMTVFDNGNTFHDQIYARPLSSPGKAPIEINGMTGTFAKYDQGNMIIVEVELELDGKVSSMTAHTEVDEAYLAALLGLFSPATQNETAGADQNSRVTSGSTTTTDQVSEVIAISDRPSEAETSADASVSADTGIPAQSSTSFASEAETDANSVVGRWNLTEETDGENIRSAEDLKTQISMLLYENGTSLIVKNQSGEPIMSSFWTQQGKNVAIGDKSYLLEEGQLITADSNGNSRQIFQRVSWPMKPLSTLTVNSMDQYTGDWNCVAAAFSGYDYLIPSEFALIGNRSDYSLSISEQGVLLTLPIPGKKGLDVYTLTPKLENNTLNLYKNETRYASVNLYENGWVSFILGGYSSSRVTIYLQKVTATDAANGSAIPQSPIALTLSSDKDTTSVYAGKSLKFTATFGDPTLVSAKQKNNQVTWAVLDADGSISSDAEIDSKGTLKVSKALEATKEITVKATSEKFGTSDAMNILLIPVVTAVNVEPDVISLFLVDGVEETVRVSLEPASVPLTGLTWTASPKNIIEIEEHGDGTATIRPLKAGKATVTVKEGSGKTGKFTITVKQPVESLDLSFKGKATPGKSLNISANLSPKNVTDKTLTWAVDVDERIATISSKGQLKISKDAPIGTVIIVSCTAEGAPEPIVSTLEITVEEK